ncbi:potassium transporter KefB [Sphingobacteriales bacterium UPWRP_1]|nr:potassium transporter KefB [Sphingobacteriales bacterium TSM_CSM]PSJ76340.1 potassium transporter KefB [Sphingobacteriales bacterium UPWRP_1]
MHIPLLEDLIIILCFSIAVVFVFHRLRQPAIVGFLATGMLIGPSGLSLVKAPHDIHLLSEIGVVLLLFVIGLELSFRQLISIKRTVFIGGTLQVGFTILLVFAALYLWGIAPGTALFTGFLFSLSSTAVVLRILQEKNEINAPHGRVALGILIFQDIAVVPMMLLAPMLAGKSGNMLTETPLLLGKVAGVVLLTYLGARYLIPHLFYYIAQTRNKELFLLTTIAFCFAVAQLTALSGLSLALGAFLAGLIISGSDYSHQASSNIIPFRELFTSFFFVSIGMLLDLSFVYSHFFSIAGITLLVILAKTFTAALAAQLLKYPVRTALLTGFSLFQVGEFAFVLSASGIEYGLLNNYFNQYFLSVSIITMLLTPIVITCAPAVFDRMAALPLFARYVGSPPTAVAGNGEPLQDHMVIIGYGLNGTNVAKAAKHAGIDYRIIELNFETVVEAKNKGEQIIFGDATQPHILHEARLEIARVAVIAISDPKATKAIVSNIRNISPTVYLIVRTRFVKETDELIALGADEVIPEEFETSIEIFSRALLKYLIPLDEVEKLVQDVRTGNYQMLRPKTEVAPVGVFLNQPPNINISCLRVAADSGRVSGKTIADAEIRKTWGITILAINRYNSLISVIEPHIKILQNDLLYVTGNTAQIDAFYKEVA